MEGKIRIPVCIEAATALSPKLSFLIQMHHGLCGEPFRVGLDRATICD
jgi:hypothetical protein